MTGYRITAHEPTVGVFLHSIFQIPGWGLRDAGFAGWEGCIDWACRTGYDACTLTLFPSVRAAGAADQLPVLTEAPADASDER